MVKATNPRREDAQGGPRLRYIFVANNCRSVGGKIQWTARLGHCECDKRTGKAAPARLRTTVLAARADAATDM
jgi:hypothetical protein